MGVFMAQVKSGYSDLCKAIGHIVINWSAAEQTLDMCVTIIFRYCGGNKLRKDLPRSLNVKTKFMRDAFRKLIVLKQLTTSGLAIMDQVEALAKIRHEMVHGALAVPEAINGVWRFLKFDYGEDIHTARDVSFSIDDFRGVGKKMMVLGEGLLILANRLKIFAPRP